MPNSLHQIFANLKFQTLSLHVSFMFWEYTHSRDHVSLFCLKIAWVVAKLWWSNIWSVESSFIHSKQKSINSYTCILWDVITRGVINSVCSPLVIHTLKLYRTTLYFWPSLFIKKTIELFHNLPNFRCTYRWRSRSKVNNGKLGQHRGRENSQRNNIFKILKMFCPEICMKIKWTMAT